MKNPVIHSPASYLSMPWRNGLGTTTELVKHPILGDGRFTWRISMADVIEDGPFSYFEGYDRTLLLLTGQGLSLIIGAQQPLILSKPLDIARFRGEDKTMATLHKGPITDFNIMTDRTRCQARVERSQKNTPPPLLDLHCDELLVFSVDAELQLESESHPVIAIPGQHLLQAQTVRQQFQVGNSAAFIAVQINYL